jgi:arylsulfatase
LPTKSTPITRFSQTAYGYCHGKSGAVQLGQLFRHLKDAGEWDNTLVVFFSDNGANGSEMHQYPQTDKGWLERNSDNRFENLGRKFSRIATGPAWAQVSMTPFRMYKGFPAEGGIRSPLIIRGPGVANQGSRSDAFAHVMDIAVTILDATKTPVPGPIYKGRKIHPPRGRSLLPVMRGKSKAVYEDDIAVSWELFGLRAVRKGDLKLLWLPKPFGKDHWQLYNLASDPGELNDLSERLPKTRDEMIQVWNRYASETGVILPSQSVLSR